MEETKGIRKSKGFKTLSSFVTSLFLFTTVLNSVSVTNADTVGESQTKAVVSSNNYKELSVNWTRTKDVREGTSYNVHNSINSFDKYWTKSGSTYTMKSNEDIDSNGTAGIDAAQGEEGIFLMQQLFTRDAKTVVFDYDSLINTMGATDTNTWDGKTSNSYSKYRHDVVNEYLATAAGDYYHLKDIQNPKNPTTNIKKADDLNIDSYPEFATWQYMKYGKSTRGTDQMRLFQGNFTIEEGDINKYNYYLTAGNNKDNILAIDDTVMVLVDGVPTDINYTTADYSKTTVKLKNGDKTYDINFNQTKNCRRENNLPVTCEISASDENNRHAALSVFTDTLHVHLGEEIQNSIAGEKVLGDVTNIISDQGGTSHKIEVIASDYNLSGGMTKLNIIRVPKPTTELVKEAYVSDKLVASSANGTSSAVKNNDTISYKFTYKNTGDAPIYNILFEDNLLNATIGAKDGNCTVIIDGKTYAKEDVKVEKYDASGNLIKTSDASLLTDENEALNKGEYVVVSSDKMVHKPTKGEIDNGKVENTVTTTANYRGYYKEEKLTNKADAKVTVKVQEDSPKIEVVKEAYGDSNYSKLIASSTKVTNSDSIAKGQTAYYKFKITNTGDSELKDIKLNDSNLGILINSENYENVDGKELGKDNLVIKKYDKDGKEVSGVSGLDCFKALGVNESIVIYDNSNIIKTNINSTFKNTVNVQGTSKDTDKVVKDNANVSVEPKNPEIDVTKTAFTDTSTENSVQYVSIGQKVYYKFAAKNTGDVDLENIYFEDNSFNGKDSVKVSEDGVYVNGAKSNNSTVKVSKFDINGIETKGGLELLKSLKVREKVIITDISNIYRETINDDLNKLLKNTVTGYGTYKGAGDNKKVNDSDTVVVKPTIQNINVSKYAKIKNDDNSETVVASSENENMNTTVIAGTNVYYTLGFENVGPFKMNNITFNDTTLNVKINSNGITVNGKAVDASNVKVVKYQVKNEAGTKTEGNLSLLNEDLMPGWKIEVSCDNCLKDVKNEAGQMLNNVEGTGDYKTNTDGKTETLKDTADVKVDIEDPTTKPDASYNKIKVQKQALVDGNIVTDSENKDINEKVNVGKKINYILTVTNNGRYTLKNVTITDKDLDVVITQNNVTKYGSIVNDSKSFKITKYASDGSLKVAGTIDTLKDILSELQPNEKIVVSDDLLLSYTSNTPEIKANEVVTQGEGYEKNPTDKAKIETPIVDSNVLISKDVYKITRDGNVIYDKNKDSIDPLKVRVYPGDKVQFTYTIKNNTEVKVENLFIKDLLQNPDMKDFKDVTDWTFTKDGAEFNHTNFALDAGESIDILSNEWIVPDNCKKNVINTVELYQKESDGTEKFINKDDAKLRVYPRVYINMDCPSDTSKEFYVTVKGDNGFETSMYIKDKDKVEISDVLDFDVNYTVTETIPMNFTYKGIDIEKGTDINGNKKDSKNLTFNLMTVTHPENITLHNEKRDSDEFQADSEVTNTLKYVEK